MLWRRTDENKKVPKFNQLIWVKVVYFIEFHNPYSPYPKEIGQTTNNYNFFMNPDAPIRYTFTQINWQNAWNFFFATVNLPNSSSISYVFPLTINDLCWQWGRNGFFFREDLFVKNFGIINF